MSQPNQPPLPGPNPFSDLPEAQLVGYYQPPAERLGDDLAMRILLPVGRSPWAIVAGYLGLFSMLFFPAPLAVIAGVLAIRQIRRNPGSHGMGRAIFGLVMGGIFTIGLIGFAISLALS